MGCAVNGPGEARDADVAVTGGDGVGMLFLRGKPYKKVPYDNLLDELLKLIDDFESNRDR
jgi:(E)-4-hydroxy-3-methylbut-2-enyl-diphosphate synthase